MAVQWMTERDSTEWMVFHHTGDPRAKDRTNQQAYDRLVEHGRESLTSYSIVVLVDREKKRVEIKDMPWPRSRVTNHAFGISKRSMGISVEGNFEIEEWEDWIENELVYLAVKIMSERDSKGDLVWPLLSIKRIIAHRDCVRFDKRNATACNGKNFYAAMPRIKRKIEEGLKKAGCFR